MTIVNEIDKRGTDVIISLADSGWCRTFGAQEFAGMTLEEAVAKAEAKKSPYNR